jgi:Skp family chaperone for outer membrane proteins
MLQTIYQHIRKTAEKGKYSIVIEKTAGIHIYNDKNIKKIDLTKSVIKSLERSKRRRRAY